MRKRRCTVDENNEYSCSLLYKLMRLISVLLILASQRFETFVNDWVGIQTEWVSTDVTTKRGAPPTIVEWFILAWVSGNKANEADEAETFCTIINKNCFENLQGSYGVKLNSCGTSGSKNT